MLSPIEMLKESMEKKNEDESAASFEEFETVNRATALWQMPKKDVSEAEYFAFYKHLAHDFEDPLCYEHYSVEGTLEYKGLFYIPQRAPFDLWNRERPVV